MIYGAGGARSWFSDFQASFWPAYCMARCASLLEGVWTSPEGAALVAALAEMKDRGAVAADARVVLVLTGAGIKYDPPPLPPAVDLTGADEEIVDQLKRRADVQAVIPQRIFVLGGRRRPEHRADARAAREQVRRLPVNDVEVFAPCGAVATA